jgi:hypothetical protein
VIGSYATNLSLPHSIATDEDGYHQTALQGGMACNPQVFLERRGSYGGFDDGQDEEAANKKRRSKKQQGRRVSADGSSSAGSLLQTPGSQPPTPTATYGSNRQQPQLRTASRAPKKYSPGTRRPAGSTEEVKARAAHNQVEQQYRRRLNAQFEQLLAATAATASGHPGHQTDGRGDRELRH